MVHKDGGPVSITLRANSAIAAGRKFSLWNCDGTPHGETWALLAGHVDRTTHPIDLPAETLLGKYVSWSMSVCALRSGVDSGIVELEVSQDGVSCAVTKPLQWSLEDLPLCAATGDNRITIQRNLAFRSA